jgi:aminoglycoside phosphotransferase family enzyme/predicted kinase
VSQAGTPREIIDFFLDPKSYPHPVDSVTHTQTHVSHIFLAGEFVYKVKKPVDLGFLDFSTLEKRRAAAVAELVLNRRLAPGIYLDVAAVHRDESGRLSFEAPSLVEEVAVVMRRLPAERRLAHLIATAEAGPSMMASLGRLIAEFHRRAETSAAIAAFGSLEVVSRNWDENFLQTEPFVGRTLTWQTWTRCKEEIERYLRVYAGLFAERIAAGRIRDCHGDLQTEDIFVERESGACQVLDCIEFNERFRYSDTLADIAFLSMDLRSRGRADLAAALLAAYYAAGDDAPLPSLLRFYESYRAYVRGKVRSFVLDQPEVSAAEKHAAAAEARRFFELAHADAARLRPRLVLVAGLMGSGKTRQSLELGGRAGARVLHSDVVRKQLAGLDPAVEQKVPFGTGIYSAEWTERTYGALLDAARAELGRGNSVVLDASWSQARLRARARAVAAEYQALFAIVECRAPDAVLRQRLSRPARPITDGRIELLDDQAAGYEAPQDGEAERLLRIDTSGELHATAETVYGALFI